jgi:chromosome segregation ATPase
MKKVDSAQAWNAAVDTYEPTVADADRRKPGAIVRAAQAAGLLPSEQESECFACKHRDREIEELKETLALVREKLRVTKIERDGARATSEQHEAEARKLRQEHGRELLEIANALGQKTTYDLPGLAKRVKAGADAFEELERNADKVQRQRDRAEVELSDARDDIGRLRRERDAVAREATRLKEERNGFREAAAKANEELTEISEALERSTGAYLVECAKERMRELNELRRRLDELFAHGPLARMCDVQQAIREILKSSAAPKE